MEEISNGSENSLTMDKTKEHIKIQGNASNNSKNISLLNKFVCWYDKTSNIGLEYPKPRFQSLNMQKRLPLK